VIPNPRHRKSCEEDEEEKSQGESIGPLIVQLPWSLKISPESEQNRSCPANPPKEIQKEPKIGIGLHIDKPYSQKLQEKIFVDEDRYRRKAQEEERPEKEEVAYSRKGASEDGAMPKAIEKKALPSFLPAIPFFFNLSEKP
jgi:hypothetical protein